MPAPQKPYTSSELICVKKKKSFKSAYNYRITLHRHRHDRPRSGNKSSHHHSRIIALFSRAKLYRDCMPILHPHTYAHVQRQKSILCPPPVYTRDFRHVVVIVRARDH